MTDLGAVLDMGSGGERSVKNASHMFWMNRTPPTSLGPGHFRMPQPAPPAVCLSCTGENLEL